VVVGIVVYFGVECCVVRVRVATGIVVVFVFCSYFGMGCVVCLAGSGTMGVMYDVSRIVPTFVAVIVGTGVVRFLVLLQKTHVVCSGLYLPVMTDRSRSLFGCYYARRQPVCLHSLLLSYSSCPLDSTPEFCLLSYPGIGVGVPGYVI
jgi:hypothetical protein